MAIVHRYVLVEITQAGALLLDDQQRTVIRTAMGQINLPWTSGQPANLFQALPSLDGNKAIYEITYDDQVTPATAFAQVAAALGIDSLTLQSVIQYTIFGDGEPDAESWKACLQYLREHLEEWEVVEEV